MGLVFIILLLPVTNKIIPFIWSAGLKGAVTETPNANFTLDSWFSGTYQEKKEKYWNTHIGFYPDFIRINNQIDFSCFGLLHAKDVIEGEAHYFYERAYIESYIGKDRLADSVILMDCKRIKWIQDSLTSRGKKFLFVIGTNKADYFPEYIPGKYKVAIPKSRNYHRYLRYFDFLAISYIDFNAYFMRQKGKTTYPLITKFNTHWSSYGASIVSDSIIRYLNLKYYDQRLIQPVISYTESKTYNSHDQEAFEPLNLIIGSPAKEITAWPQYAYPKNKNTVMPKAIFLADSYFWEIYDQKVMESVFSDLQFWYYNREFWGKDHRLLGDSQKNPELGDDYLKEADVVVLIATEFHLNCLTDDFIKKIKKVYKLR